MEGAPMKGVALLLSDFVTVPIGAALSAVRDIGNEVVGESDVLISTQSSSLMQLPIESSSLNVVISILENPETIREELLGEIIRVLKPGGTFITQVPVLKDQGDKPSFTMERKLLISGLVNVQSTDAIPILQKDGAEVLTIKAKKASWTVGSSFSIKKVANSLPKIQFDDDSDLIDEDSLLTEEDLKKPELPPVGDCEVSSTRKACKNCSCGRAELEKAEKVPKLGLTAEQLNNPQSACGNCGLGDAFRCGTCPYKGLPPFKQGEKISLSSNFLVADI